jgi:predicted RNA binding protein YcfA (HicA-like mRNA interferase family)
MSSWPSAKARRVFAALKRIGWRHDRTVGSHKIMKRMGGRTTHSPFTILKNSVRQSLRKSQKRPAFNLKICEGTVHTQPFADQSLTAGVEQRYHAIRRLGRRG